MCTALMLIVSLTIFSLGICVTSPVVLGLFAIMNGGVCVIS